MGTNAPRSSFAKLLKDGVTSRILQINDENGTTHTEQGEVALEFLSYYQNLLGGTRRCLPMDIRYLSLWARHIITDEEAAHLLLPFSPDDVKQAVFDIAEDNAPGPDGFSSGFFKAAWLVAAFIPGRSIGNNIMLGQELFTGYNQLRLPPRCAMKVDIGKAYDTVEWDFLLAIEECVTTASFSIGLNGKPYGFFAGAKGLRQGDPLSPYVFVLVMEVLHLGLLQLIEQDMQFTNHWKCEPTRY
ncbi:UNVERIFIED_CONTAM: hypothetical protein Sindi_3056200, partial [Sesamum indicum]